MVITPEKYIDRLNELLQKKLLKLEEISDLTRKQTEALTEDGLDSLSKLIEEKQRRMDEIDKLDDDFGTYFGRLKSVLGITKLDQLDAARLDGAAASGARQLRGLTSEIMALIRNISEIEQVNSQKSKKLLDEFSGEIRKINQGKKANKAYNPAPYSVPSYFLDKKK